MLPRVNQPMDFNPTKQPVAERTATENFEGGPAFEADTPEMGLFVASTACLIESQFYRDDTDQLDALRSHLELAADHNPEFAVQMAAYAREVMYLRDAPQVMLVDLAHHDEAKRYVRAYAPHIIQRADEPATILGVWNTLYPDSDTLPKPLKKGINDALEQFDAYHFAKYDSDRRQYNVRDVFNMTRPKATSPERQVLHDRIMWGHLDEYPDVDPLPAPKTWEVIKSEAGQNDELDDGDAWNIALPYMGMFARIRNIRNMLEAGLTGEEIVDTEMIGDEFDPDAPDGRGDTFTISEDGMTVDEVRRRKLYPFRFYRAYTAMQGRDLNRRRRRRTFSVSADHEADLYDERVAEFLSDAIDAASRELDDSLGDTFVAVDLSRSMRHPLSRHSTVTYKEVGALFGAALATKGADVTAFGDSVARVQVHHESPTLQTMDAIMGHDDQVGGSTNTWKAILDAVDRGREYDRVVILTDEQAWDSSHAFRNNPTVREAWQQFQAEVNPDARAFTIDLASYPTLSFPEGEAYHIGGWSEQVLDFIGYAERPDAAIEDVKAIEPANADHLPEE